MQAWILEPLDPLIFGDGRPSTEAGIRSLSAPQPRTLVGALRTRAGSPKGRWESTPEKALTWGMKGPLMVQKSKGAWELLSPAPADALMLEASKNESSSMIRRRLRVLSAPAGALASSPPVGLQPYDPSKPSRNAPPLWRWSELESWLLQSADTPEERDSSFGVHLPIADRRTHVGIDPERQRAEDGKLFVTEGRDFSPRKPKQQGEDWTSPLAMVLWSTAPLYEGVGPVGGERRLVRWSQASIAQPTIPAEILASARKGDDRKGYARIQLLTAARLKDGSDWKNTRVTVKAQISGRAQAISGWDIAVQQPKKVQRLVPAGSVFFVELNGNEAEREQLVRDLWFSSICDDPQDQRDGLGLAVVGVWDGQSIELKV